MKVKPKFGFLAGSNSEAIQHAYNAETDCGWMSQQTLYTSKILRVSHSYIMYRGYTSQMLKNTKVDAGIMSHLS